MSKRYYVAEGEHEFTYPADAISLKAIREASGLSQMSDEAKAKLKFKTVVPGNECSDMPEPALSIYIERGWVVEGKVEVKPTTQKDEEK